MACAVTLVKTHLCLCVVMCLTQMPKHIHSSHITLWPLREVILVGSAPAACHVYPSCLPSSSVSSYISLSPLLVCLQLAPLLCPWVFHKATLVALLPVCPTHNQNQCPYTQRLGNCTHPQRTDGSIPCILFYVPKIVINKKQNKVHNSTVF